MARSRPCGRTKSDHWVCQAARFARAAAYRERISISAERQEILIAAVNARSDDIPAPRRRRCQRSKESKHEGQTAREVPARGRCSAADRKAQRQDARALREAVNCAAERDPHATFCNESNLTAEWGLRGSKNGGNIHYYCELHGPIKGCFHIDRDRAAWVQAREEMLRKANSACHECKQEKKGLGLSAPPWSWAGSAAWNDSQKKGVRASMPMSQLLIATLLNIGGVEPNPGPSSEELASRESWLEYDSRIKSKLLDHLMRKEFDLAVWKSTPEKDRIEYLTRWRAEYQGPGEWADGWDAFLKAVPTAAGPSTTGTGASFNTFVPLVGAESEGINQRRKGGFFTPRVETCHKILHRVQEKGVLILAGSPCSGKTSLCQLVYEEAERSAVYESVYYVNCARVGSGGQTFDEVFYDQAGVTFAEASKSPANSPDKQAGRPSASSSATLPPLRKKLLIFDEVQNLYSPGPGHALLWPLAKDIGARFKPGGARQGRVNIILSASRGSNPSATGLPSTPISFSDDQRIPLRLRLGFATPADSNSPEPAVQFTMEEYEQVIESFLHNIGFAGDKGQLRTLGDVIEATTERHPGSVLHVLDLLKGHSPSNFAGRAAEWAAKAVDFVASPRLLDSLSGTRSFPPVSELVKDREALNLISRLLASRGQESLEAVRRSAPGLADKAEDFAKSGYLLLEKDSVSFTSGLHMEFYRYNLARRVWGTPKQMPQSLEAFLEEALSKMQPPMLQNSLNLSTRGGVVGGVLESHFQFELYSAVTSLLPEGAYFSPTVGKIYGLEAYVDFVLHGMGWKWAFELLIDGRDLREHLNRFLPNGRYHPMVLGNQIDAWVVVDLRNHKTGKPRKARGPGVCHVFFDSKYEKAIVDYGNNQEHPIFLMGRR
ncbi:hypothetical protein KFL_000260010 [Klebsormidium nitens]|uniref:AAA+ ATPase domain-containing protein n=1 Tax=Klebsormidium nitens TaxID=105231 RepID=A0A1Y1HRI6_KLENI|nr:hypothetical protein KFL_000260010 [Klebsormidium nitens]|eukprot:GAQ79186.1 hypothetical protein KFL_000260010 [Klebsormidium nitens]